MRMEGRSRGEVGGDLVLVGRFRLSAVGEGAVPGERGKGQDAKVVRGSGPVRAKCV